MQNQDPGHRVAASIPFHLLFREIPNETKPLISPGRPNKTDMVTTFQINAKPKDGSIAVTENDQVCKKFLINGKKDVVLKITLGMAEDSKRKHSTSSKDK